jgi:hypothetical protein
MGRGVFESSQAIVPGTVHLFDNEINQEDSSHLKHSVDGKTSVSVLIAELL